jgi:hypothetical protein
MNGKDNRRPLSEEEIDAILDAELGESEPEWLVRVLEDPADDTQEDAWNRAWMRIL